MDLHDNILETQSRLLALLELESDIYLYGKQNDAEGILAIIEGKKEGLDAHLKAVKYDK